MISELSITLFPDPVEPAIDVLLEHGHARFLVARLQALDDGAVLGLGVGAVDAIPKKNIGPAFSLLFFQPGVPLFDQLIEFVLLLRNAPRYPFFILRARGCSSLFD